MLKTIQIRTTKRNEMLDITERIQEIVTEAGIPEGICVLQTPHTTAGITINENADPDVKVDMLNGLGKIIPREFGFIHMEGNSDSHIKSSLVGASEHIIIHEGRLLLGTWQGIYFYEFDGPRSRKVHIKLIQG